MANGILAIKRKRKDFMAQKGQLPLFQDIL